ncbi:hypothetical protein ABR737_03210 [Streptomyces sp. Edi2]|uniref:hypothetical protein n=1 Tax=Streptomyces TaxID=1883 RepID=UPI00330608A4
MGTAASQVTEIGWRRSLIMMETTAGNPVAQLSAYLQDLVRDDPARALPAVGEVVMALHAVALASVNVAPSPDFFEVGKNLARIDDAGTEIMLATGDLLRPACREQSAVKLSRMDALIATLPAPRTQQGWRQPSTGRRPLPSVGGA